MTDDLLPQSDWRPKDRQKGVTGFFPVVIQRRVLYIVVGIVRLATAVE